MASVTLYWTAVGAAAEVLPIRTLLIGLGAVGLVFGLGWAAVTRRLWAATIFPQA